MENSEINLGVIPFIAIIIYILILAIGITYSLVKKEEKV